MTLAGVLFGWGVLINAQNAQNPQSAPNLPPSEAIKHRIANFKKIGRAFKGIRDELRSADPKLPVIQESAAQIESLGSQIVTWFPPGSGPTDEPAKDGGSEDDDDKTNAKPAVWTDRATFEQAQKRLYGEAQKMNAAAQSGDKTAIAAQFKELGKACKNCHDTFRND